MLELILLAYGPSYYTLSGVRRTISALGPNYVGGQYGSFGLVLNFSQAYGWINNGNTFRDLATDLQPKDYIDGFYSASDLFGLGYGTRFFELAVMGSYHFDAWDKNNPDGTRKYPDNIHSHGPGDMLLAGKIMYPIHFENISFSLGVAGFYSFPNISNIQIADKRDTSGDKFISDTRGWFQRGGVFRTFSLYDQGYGVRGILSFLPSNKYMQIHLNYGFDTKSLSDKNDDIMFYGGSVIFTLPGFHPFFEVALEDFYKGRDVYGDSPFYMTGGFNLDANAFIITIGVEKIFWFDGKTINTNRTKYPPAWDTYLAMDISGRQNELTKPKFWFPTVWDPTVGVWLGLSYTFVPIEKKPEKKEEKVLPTYIAGVVFDKSSGKTLGNVTVFLKEKNVSVITGDDGAYKFENVEPGSYTLIFQAKGYATSTRVVDVKPGQPSIANVELVPAKAVYITGVVYDRETNRPIGGARVLVKELNVEVTTDDDGSYKVENIVPGAYTLIFTAPGYQSFSASVAVEDKPVVKDGYLTKAEVGVQKTEEVKLGYITGLVYDKEKNTPIAGVQVVLKEKNKTLTTDQTGAFRFDSLPYGAYTLSFSAEGYLPYSEIITLSGGQPYTMKVMLSPVPKKKTATLLGKVSDAESGRGIVGAVVSVEGVASTTTLEGGIYRIENIAVGTYTIKVSSMDYETYTEVVKLNEGENVKNFTLKPSIVKGGLVINVIDKDDKKPLAAIITFEGANIGPYETDPTSGSVTIRDIPAGTYTIRVSGKDPKYVAQVRTVVVSKDIKDITFELVKKGTEITFRNIYFDLNKATLRPDAEPALRQICEFLKENPDAIVEVQGHTDERGSDSYNLRLSQARAESVVEWLVNNGCSTSDRLVARGYGESMPVVKNAKTEAEHSLNRRVVIKVIGIRK
ncbi:MAG: carboxypeptidase regulatory-like domain-containing protein [candidate division WOR-3 bacterium]